MKRGEVLVIGLRGIKRHSCLDAGDYRRPERMLLRELPDVGLGNQPLPGVDRPDLAPVLGALVGTLIVELGGIRGDGEVDPQQRAVTDDVRIEDSSIDSACPVVPVLTSS